MQLAEDLREVAGMQHDQPHAFPDTLLHPVNDFIPHFAMNLVAPPDQHISVFQALLGQAMLGHVLGCHFKADVLGAIEGLGNGAVNALRIKLGHQAHWFFRVRFHSRSVTRIVMFRVLVTW